MKRILLLVGLLCLWGCGVESADRMMTNTTSNLQNGSTNTGTGGSTNTSGSTSFPAPATNWQNYVSAWAASPLQKVSPTTSSPASNTHWDGTKGHLYLAKNEWESLQLILKAQSTSQTLTPVVQDFQGPQGAVISGSRLKIFKGYFVNVQEISDPLGKKGTFPDALLPLNSPLALSTSQNTLLWLTLKTTDTDIAGDYQGNIDFQTSGGTSLFQITLRLTIWPFSLPQTPPLKSYYLIDTPYEILNRHSALSQTNSQKKQLVMKYADFLLDYRMYPGNLQTSSVDLGTTPEVTIQNGQISFDFTASDQWLDYVLNTKKVGIFRLPFPLEKISQHASYQSNTFVNLSKSALNQLYQHYQTKGWIGDHFLFVRGIQGYTHTPYISDEPFNGQKAGYDEMFYWSNLVDSVNPNLNFTVATPPYNRTGWGNLDGHIDSYTYFTWEVDSFAQKTLSLLQSGKSVYLVPNSFADNIDYHRLYARGLGFFSFKHNLTGLEQWDVFAWYSMNNKHPDPWKGEYHTVFGVGAGQLLYPGAQKGVNGPISSARFEQNRDGIEDHSYLTLLAGLSSPQYARQVARRLVPSFYTEMELSPALFHKLRRFLADEIIRLQQGGTPYQSKSGYIYDQNQQPLSGAQVVGEYFATETDQTGKYEIYYKSSPAIEASAVGYETTSGQGGNNLTLSPRSSLTLFTFEGGGESYSLDFTALSGGATGSQGGSRVAAYATDGSQSLKWEIPANCEAELGLDLNTTDWSSYQYLAFDVYNSGQYALPLEVGLLDGNSKYRYIDKDINDRGLRLLAPPQQKTTLLVPLDSVHLAGYMGYSHRQAVDIKNIIWFSLSVETTDHSGPEVLYLDNIRLLK